MKLALATMLAFLAVVPAAHAGWMTGNGYAPIYTDNDACRNGMQFSYATFLQVPLQSSLDIHAHAVVIDTGAAPQDPPNLALTVSFSPTLTVPRDALQLPLNWTGIDPSLFPRQVNRFDYSEDFALDFNRTLFAGTPLRVQFHDWIGTLIFSPHRYRVANCWYGVIRSRYELAVHLASAELIAQLKPRKIFVEGKTTILVLDKPLAGEPGERIRLEYVK